MTVVGILVVSEALEMVIARGCLPKCGCKTPEDAGRQLPPHLACIPWENAQQDEEETAITMVTRKTMPLKHDI